MRFDLTTAQKGGHMSNKEFLETLLSAVTSVSNGTAKQVTAPPLHAGFFISESPAC